MKSNCHWLGKVQKSQLPLIFEVISLMKETSCSLPLDSSASSLFMPNIQLKCPFIYFLSLLFLQLFHHLPLTFIIFTFFGIFSLLFRYYAACRTPNFIYFRIISDNQIYMLWINLKLLRPSIWPTRPVIITLKPSNLKWQTNLHAQDNLSTSLLQFCLTINVTYEDLNTYLKTVELLKIAN